MAASVDIANSLVFRSPTLRDGASMWRIAAELESLEANSPYSYLMVCRDFFATSLVAELDAVVAGFISAYRPPQSLDVLFVWQIGVAADYQSRGLGKAMLNQVVRQPGCAGIHYVEATVTPSNLPSQGLFRSLAKSLGAECHVSDCFPRGLFPEGAHEDENLFRIGPF